MKIYLDVCCLNRPFDDQTQERIRLEAEAILFILKRIKAGEWELVSSEMVEDEIEQTPDMKRRERLRLLMAEANQFVLVTEPEVTRAKQLRQSGLNSADALHLACAESGGVDLFLTTDDKLLRRALALTPPLAIRVFNPLAWLMEQEK